MTETVKVNVEEAEVNAYMDAAKCNGEGPGEADRLQYLKVRHEQVKAEYKALMLQKEECEGRKYEGGLDKLTPIFRENWKTRKWVVGELRRMGVEVDDKFIPKAETANA